MVAMKRLPAVLVLAALILAPLLLPAAAAPQQGKSPEDLVGKPAPPLKADFTIKSMEKSLAELKGQVVLLNFVTMWCSNCEGCLPLWNDWQKTYDIKGLVVVGVTFYGGDYDRKPTMNNTGQVETAAGKLRKNEEQELLKRFAQFHKIGFRMLMLPKAEMDEAKKDFHLTQVPLMVLVDRQGRVRQVGEGASPATLEAMRKMIETVLMEKK